MRLRTHTVGGESYIRTNCEGCGSYIELPEQMGGIECVECGTAINVREDAFGDLYVEQTPGKGQEEI